MYQVVFAQHGTAYNALRWGDTKQTPPASLHCLINKKTKLLVYWVFGEIMFKLMSWSYEWSQIDHILNLQWHWLLINTKINTKILISLSQDNKCQLIIFSALLLFNKSCFLLHLLCFFILFGEMGNFFLSTQNVYMVCSFGRIWRPWKGPFFLSNWQFKLGVQYLTGTHSVTCPWNHNAA